MVKKLSKMIRNVLTLCLLIITVSLRAQSFTPAEDIQIRKSFYLLYVLERKSDVHNAVVKNAVFNTIAHERQERITKAYSTCANASCIAEALLWTPSEI